MIALNFILLSLLIGIFAAVSIPFLVLFFFGLWKRRSWMKWLGGIPAGIILILSLCGFGFLVFGFMHPWSETTDPKNIHQTFVANFGFEPGVDFKPEHQKIYCLADYGCMHLSFQASAETFDRIRALGFQPIPQSSFMSATGGSGAPDWWVQATESSNECFANETWKGNFSSNRAYLFYDRASDRVYFFSQGID